MHRLSLSGLLISSLFSLTCTEGRVGARASQEPTHAERVDTVVDHVAGELVEAVVERVDGATRETALRSRFAADELGIELDDSHRRLLTDFYAERNYRPVFVSGDHLTAAGVELAETLAAVRDHGLDPADYHRAEIADGIRAMYDPDTVEEARNRAALSDDERETLRAWVDQTHATAGELPDAETTVALLLSSDAANPLPRLAALVHNDTLAATPEAAAAIDTELHLADGYLRLARDLHFNNEHYFTDAMKEERGWDFEEEGALAAATDTLLAESFSRAAGETGVAAELRSLWPPFRQYELLIAGNREYRGYVEAGGWGEVDAPYEMRPGRDATFIPDLRRRLAAENYWDGDLESRTFDEELSAALAAYQAAHQTRADGYIGEATIESLNVPAERRLAQIIATQERLRMTRLARDAGGEYIVVSLPAFRGELWDEGEVVHSWDTIIGRLKRRRNDDGTMRYWGATPLFSDYMENIVFNPYWNVPGQIYRDEYADRIEEDPEFLTEHNMEFYDSSNGHRWLRQRPGPDNALGVVKFLFPNEHDVYMHDTNQPDLFSYDIRAFSHGCIRVKDPLELATVLLARDQDTAMRTARGMAHSYVNRGAQQWVPLSTPVPVHLEYFATEVGADNRVHFLADVYRLDRARVDELETHIREREALRRTEMDAIRAANQQARIERAAATAANTQADAE